MSEDKYLNVALPKGRLGEKVYAAFEKAGYPCPEVMENSRKLVFENPDAGVRYFWVKPSDVAIYVERGAADLGAAGKDILLEYAPDVYELVDLGLGKCRMAVAAPENYRDDPERTLRVATKFPNIARNYYADRGRDIDIIRLNGSIELAPVLGLSDVIMDIVETGTTLRENHLAVVDTVLPISARLIANKSAYRFKNREIRRLAAAITEAMTAVSMTAAAKTAAATEAKV
ncbi:MAG: ATP phosphoribosyltransferase [Clostridia bacterium]|nr:ATP phosphoribosyltransferase [Clostridia bacterium]